MRYIVMTGTAIVTMRSKVIVKEKYHKVTRMIENEDASYIVCTGAGTGMRY